MLGGAYQQVKQRILCCLFGSRLGGQRYSAWLRLKLLLGGDVEANPGPVTAVDIVSVTTRLATWLHDAGGSCEVRSYCLGQVSAAALCGQEVAGRSAGVPCWLPATVQQCCGHVGASSSLPWCPGGPAAPSSMDGTLCGGCVECPEQLLG